MRLIVLGDIMEYVLTDAIDTYVLNMDTHTLNKSHSTTRSMKYRFKPNCFFNGVGFTVEMALMEYINSRITDKYMDDILKLPLNLRFICFPNFVLSRIIITNSHRPKSIP